MKFGDALKGAIPFVGPTLASGLFDYYAMQEAQKEGSRDREQAAFLNAENYKMQKEFAQNSIRWRVEDAVAAGIHPLAALGASGSGYTPSTVVGGSDNSRSEYLSKMGQNVSRAISSTRTLEEREIARQELRNSSLRNDLLVLQIKKAAQDLNPNPPFPTYGRYGNMLNLGEGDMYGRSDPIQADVEIPPVSDVVYNLTSTGLMPVPSKNFAQAGQNSFMTNLGWDIRNKVVPVLSGTGPGSAPDVRRYPLPKGYDYYRWNRWAGEWQPAKFSGRSAWQEQKDNWYYGNRR